MKSKTIKKAAIVVIIATILIKAGILNALFMFVLVGAIPGTQYSISPSLMFASMMAALWLTVIYVTTHKKIRSKLPNLLTK